MRIIRGLWLKIKYQGETSLRDWGMPLVILLVSLSSFGLGRLSALDDMSPNIQIMQANKAIKAQAMYPGGLIIGSVATLVYYAPWCKGIERIGNTDIRWFSDEPEALKAGYSPAKGCIGLGN
ncbi:MAG: protein of unknown function with transrane region [Candidatus Kaiserbacteria bacterium]|nr:protein of unknown function with transrane region [Candidatus Kaiserbacteria bacterium]